MKFRKIPSVLSAIFIMTTLIHGSELSIPTSAKSVTSPDDVVTKTVDATSTVQYLLSAQKRNGAFGPHEQEYTGLAWTYPAVGALSILGESVPRGEDKPQKRKGKGNSLATGGRTPYWDFSQKVGLQRFRGTPPSFEGKTWVLAHRTRNSGGTAGGKLNPDEEKLGFINLTSLHFVVSSIEGRVSNVEDVERFVRTRRTPGGGYADLVEPSGVADDKSAHVVFTAAAVLTLTRLGLDVPNKDRVVEWIRSCQVKEGGFRWHPSSKAPGNRPDVWYTREAVRALAALKSGPRDPEGCMRWINSLQNADGGFGDRPGWRSRLYSTFYAVDALKVLAGDARKGIRKKTVSQPPHETIPEGQWRVLHAWQKAPLGGAEMVERFREMGFHLVGCKQKDGGNWNEKSAQLLETARAYAASKGYDIELVANPEAYTHRVQYLGGFVGSHCGNYLLPPGVQSGHPSVAAANTAGCKRLPWDLYRTQTIAPLVKPGSLYYPEWDAGMVSAYMSYDDGVYGGNGYNAVHAAHMNGPDRIRYYPWRERYLGHLPFVADGDSHGSWRDMMRFRTLYLAKTSSYADDIDACKNRRAVCVIRGNSGVTYYGTPSAVAYLKKHRKEWQWWED